MTLSTTAITTYKQKLQEEMTRLETELSAIGMHDADTDLWDARPLEAETESDDNDRADRAEEYEERTGMVISLAKQWKDAKDALAKIEAGIYGVCEISGEEIETERLDANPAARTCMKHL